MLNRCQWLAALGLTWILLLRASLVDASEVRIPIGPYGSGMAISAEVKSLKELREEGLTLQQLDYSCGSAALATIFTSYLNIPCTEKDVIDYIVKTGDVSTIAVRKGFSLLDLKRFADSREVQAVGYRLDEKLLVALNSPVLVPLFIREQNIRHFVVFLGVRGNRAYLADPSAGRRSMPLAQFLEQWDPHIGMVFSHPKAPEFEESALAIRPEDDLTEISAPTLSVFYQSGIPNFHMPNEF